MQDEYRLVRGFEGGATFKYWHASQETSFAILAPAIKLRPYIPIDTVELGLSFEPGLMFLWIDTAPGLWLGWSANVAPDVRIWVARDFALQLGFSATLAQGTRTERVPDACIGPS